MKNKEMQGAETGELIRRFEELAIIHGELRTAKEANQAFTEQVRVWSEIRNRGAQALADFLLLLESPNPLVRLSAACKAILIAPELAEPVLEQLTCEPRTIGLTAEMTLQEWRAGRLRPLS